MENIIFIIVVALGWLIRIALKKKKETTQSKIKNTHHSFFKELKAFSDQLVFDSLPKSSVDTLTKKDEFKTEEFEEDDSTIQDKAGSGKEVVETKIKKHIKNPNFLKQAFVLKEVLERKF